MLFLIASYNKFKGLGGSTAYFTKLGVPGASVMAPLAAAFELAAGILLLVGFKRGWGILRSRSACSSSSRRCFAHTNFADGNQLNHFLKNFAIVGAAWRCS